MRNQPLPGMTDTLEFVKNLWGGMNIPGTMPGMASMPGLPGAGMSIEDLDKKIADLKAVEAWLTLNMSMLHGSIQALEIQRGTLATLKAMGESMAQAMSQTGAASESAMAPFAQFFAQSAPAPAAKPASAPPAPPPPPAPAPEAQAAPPAGADALNAAMPAAVAWWNLLQEQFKHAVTSAMPPEGAGQPEQAAAPASAPEGAAGETDVRPADAGQSANDGPDANPPPGRRGARGKTDKA